MAAVTGLDTLAAKNSLMVVDEPSLKLQGQCVCLLLYHIYLFSRNSDLGKRSEKKTSGYNEFGTISLWTPPPTISSEKSNSENCSQYRYPPSLKK